jgi:hypothetical protein
MEDLRGPGSVLGYVSSLRGNEFPYRFKICRRSETVLACIRADSRCDIEMFSGIEGQWRCEGARTFTVPAAAWALKSLYRRFICTSSALLNILVSKRHFLCCACSVVVLTCVC